MKTNYFELSSHALNSVRLFCHKERVVITFLDAARSFATNLSESIPAVMKYALIESFLYSERSSFIHASTESVEE